MRWLHTLYVHVAEASDVGASAGGRETGKSAALQSSPAAAEELNKTFTPNEEGTGLSCSLSKNSNASSLFLANSYKYSNNKC